MKKGFALLLVICLISLLSACDQKDRVLSTKSTTTGITTTEPDTASLETETVSVAAPSNTVPQAAVASKTAEPPKKPASTQNPVVSKPSINIPKSPIITSKPAEPIASSMPAVSTEPEAVSSVPEPKPEKTAKEKLIGKWRGNVDVETILQMLEIPYNGEVIYIAHTIEFTPSNTMIVTVDENGFIARIKPILKQALEESLSMEGVPIEDPAVQQDIEQFVDGFSVAMASFLNFFVEYRFEEDTLWLPASEYDAFLPMECIFINDNVLKIDDLYGGLVLERVV